MAGTMLNLCSTYTVRGRVITLGLTNPNAAKWAAILSWYGTVPWVLANTTAMLALMLAQLALLKGRKLPVQPPLLTTPLTSADAEHVPSPLSRTVT